MFTLKTANLLKPISVLFAISKVESIYLKSQQNLFPKIVAEFTANSKSVENPKTIIVTGAPASGKLAVEKFVHHNYFPNRNYCLSRKDDMLDFMPLAKLLLCLGHGYLVEMFTAEREKMVQEIETYAVQEQRNLLIFSTGLSSSLSRIKRDKINKRNTVGIFVYCTITELYRRGYQRYLLTGRWTDLLYQLLTIKNLAQELEDTLVQLSEYFVFDNSAKLPKLLVSKQEHNPSKIQKLVDLYKNEARKADEIIEKFSLFQKIISLEERYQSLQPLTESTRLSALENQELKLLIQIPVAREDIYIKQVYSKEFESRFLVDISKLDSDRLEAYLQTTRFSKHVKIDQPTIIAALTAIKEIVAYFNLKNHYESKIDSGLQKHPGVLLEDRDGYGLVKYD